MLTNGQSSCIKDTNSKDDKCKTEKNDATKPFENEIEDLNKDHKNYQNLLKCEGAFYFEHRNNKNHWFNTALLLPNVEGSLDLEIDLQ